jgi:hypothetical protein
LATVSSMIFLHCTSSAISPGCEKRLVNYSRGYSRKNEQLTIKIHS